jgi:NAD(P)-dependent dehydrogenase (short-subunit alcohol dehydrogenase family)
MSPQGHAFVTGAGTGIGRAVALALAKRGVVVTLAGRRSAPLAAVQAEIAAAGGVSAALREFDVCDEAVVAAGVGRAVHERGDISILVNCAGEAPSAPFEKTDLALWTHILNVNLTGAFLVANAALPSLRRQGLGRIVNIASTAGLIGYPYVTAYCAAKHGVVGLTRALALELARTSVTVNAVCPGFADTPLLDEAVETITRKTGRSREEARATLTRANPQGRLVTPEEVADAVLWLVSPGASAVTGQAIPIAGGEVLGG